MNNIIFENPNSLLTYCFDTSLSPMLHIHKEVELIYVIEGESYAYASQKEYLLKKDDLFINFPYQIHRYQTTVEGKFMIMVFPPEILFSMSHVFTDNIPESNVINSEHITSLIYKLMAEDKSFFHNNIVYGYLNLIMPNALKYITLLPLTDVKISSIENILNFCINHYREDLSLDIVSKSVHINKYYISKTINNLLNLSFKEFINSLRVIEACELLKNTDKSIINISEEVGFGSLRSFNRAFRAMLGKTPREYRKKL